MEKDSIVIHHSLTKDGETVSWSAIRRYHKETLGWSEIGYHFGVELVGDRYEILHGREMWENAAAVREGKQNHRGIHVCLVGNFDETPPPLAQLDRAAELVTTIAWLLKIDARQITGHRDWTPSKSCPGWALDIQKFRGEVAARLRILNERR